MKRLLIVFSYPENCDILHFDGASSTALKGCTGTAQNILVIFRSLAAMKIVKSKAPERGLILAGVVPGFAINDRGLPG